jgi:hypothetical protein
MSIISSSQISPIFAYLPNGIIREIVSYTGVTYKKRNGKYMGQIPKEDARYTLLRTIPNVSVYFHEFKGNIDPSDKYFVCETNLTRKPYIERQTRVYFVIRGYHYDGEDIMVHTLEMFGSGITPLSNFRKYEHEEIIHPNANSYRSNQEKKTKRIKRCIVFYLKIFICCTMYLIVVYYTKWRVSLRSSPGNLSGPTLRSGPSLVRDGMKVT